MTALIMLLVLMGAFAIVGCNTKTDNNDNEQEVSQEVIEDVQELEVEVLELEESQEVE